MSSTDAIATQIAQRREERRKHIELVKKKVTFELCKPSQADNKKFTNRLAKNPPKPPTPLLADLEKLNLSRHLDEVADAVMKFSYKPEFYFGAQLCAKMTQRYPPDASGGKGFLDCLLPLIKEQVKISSAGNSDTKVVRRNIARLTTDLFLVGVLPSFKMVQQSLTLLIQPDQRLEDPSTNLVIVVSYLKASMVPLVGGNIGGTEIPPLLSPSEVSTFNAIIGDYWAKLANYYTATKRRHLKLEREIQREMKERGDVPSTKTEAFSKSQETMSRLDTHMAALAEIIGTEMPSVTAPAEVTLPTEHPVDTDTPEVEVPFVDPADVVFYTRVPDITGELPPTVFQREKRDEDDGHDTDTVTARCLLAKLYQLPNTVAADQWTFDFALLGPKFNNKLLSTVTHASGHTPSYVIPLVARAIAGLTKIAGFLPPKEVEDAVATNFDNLAKNQKDIDVRVRNGALIAELAKFRVVDTHVVFRALNRLETDRTEASLRVLASILHSCGLWLFMQTSTRTALTNHLSEVETIRKSVGRSQELDAVLANAILASQPGTAAVPEPKQLKHPHVRYLRHVLSHTSMDGTVVPSSVAGDDEPSTCYSPDVAARLIAKLDWRGCFVQLSKEMVRAHRHGLSHIAAIAHTTALLADTEVPRALILDLLMERIAAGLAQGERCSVVAQHAASRARVAEQARVAHCRLLAALFVEGVVSADTLFCVSRLIMEHGHTAQSIVGDNPFDSKQDGFRIVLVCELFDRIPLDLVQFDPRMRQTLLDFQKYVFTKSDILLDHEFMLQDFHAHFNTLMERYECEEDLNIAMATSVMGNMTVMAHASDLTDGADPRPEPQTHRDKLEQLRQEDEKRRQEEADEKARMEDEVDRELDLIVDQDVTLAKQVRAGHMDVRIPLAARVKEDEEEEDNVTMTLLVKKGHKSVTRTFSVEADSKLGRQAVGKVVDEDEGHNEKLAEFLKHRAAAGDFDLEASDEERHRPRPQRREKAKPNVTKETISGFGNIVMHNR
ncbi:hypothetical protein J8273_6077 [Carpediemonas membranifera]|uniref:MIF4G domain-containing protein n=1 Tax=Carpediemonas membranifera TaxID=201153 RepID=A0A8J6B459_9EUKA|nr:hypothetical protein J8273_6077 [Carpediemonas membranifera]|eukprot:KAG9392609.1 hypothetical protein J8273_6077 [Carpediemonas membranifera]